MNNWKHSQHSNRDVYQIDVKDELVVLASKQLATKSDIGGVRQIVSPSICRGRRVRFQAELSTQNVEGAGLWLMASHSSWHITDGMYDRLVKGSTDWNFMHLVIDVPEDAAHISYGLWMFGGGKCCMRQTKFDVVDHSVAVTTKSIWDRVDKQKWKERTVSLSG